VPMAPSSTTMRRPSRCTNSAPRV